MKMLNNRISFLIIAVAFIAGCKPKPQQRAAMPPQSFEVIEIVTQDVEGYYTFPAEISGINTSQIRPKISGYIEKLFIDEGAHVKAGQKLFKLETNIQTQNASAASAQMNSATASIEAAKASVSAAEVEVNKLKPLVDKNIISGVQLETAKANLLMAKGQLSQAEANYEVAKANYQGVNENIKFSTVTSPIDGIVGKINYREGSLVSPSDPLPLTTVSDVHEVYAYFSLNEKQYLYFFQNFPGADLDEKIANMPPIELELANGTVFEEKGKLETATGQIDENTGTILFRVRFNNKSKLLSNGSTGKIKVPRAYNQVLVMPEVATYEQQGFVYAYKLNGDTVKSTIITVIDKIDHKILIESGLKEGDKIVARGIGSLRNGEVIQPQLVTIESILEK
ncbi:MAG: efflux RND transporter periplasmic adaptor subunit [Chitinophagales bacterium]